MIVVFTSAFNAEATLRRAADSLFAQSCGDFVYYLLDNGSTDGTARIIKELAARDKRIVPLANRDNLRFRLRTFIAEFPGHYKETDYLCTLDSDDEYRPAFFSEMLRFIRENRLKAATCGTDHIEAATGGLMRRKVVSENMILEGPKFAECFPAYRNFIVTNWGGLYSLGVIKKCDFSGLVLAQPMSDTVFALEVFRNAERAGVLAESLHKYYISPGSISYNYSPNWFAACKNILRLTRKYLLHFGEISRANEDYLKVLLLILIKYILPRIQTAEVGLGEKLSDLLNIFSDEETQSLLAGWHEFGVYSDRGEFIGEILNWLHAQPGREDFQDRLEEIARYLTGPGQDNRRPYE